MDTIFKTAFVYAFLWAVVRVAGRRTMKEATAFDFVLFMLIGSAMQRALTGQDYSLTNAVLIVSTLIVLDVLLSLGRREWTMFGKILKGVSTIVVEDGKPLTWRMRRARLKEDDVVDAARSRHGLERMDEIKFAILEASGEISIIPYEKTPPGGRARGAGRDG
jgi:uncharacterized membrane protein YcaP (DUF421 family)